MSVTVYSTLSCPQCMATKHWLKREKIAFDEVRLDKDADAYEYVTKDLGYGAAPVVVVRDDEGKVVDHWSGFSEKKISTLK